MASERIVWRMVGLGYREEWAMQHVTPKCAVLARRVEANSPLDALVTFTDLHAWRVGECDAVPTVPMPMGATIHADDDPTERLRVTVYPLAEEVSIRANRRGKPPTGVYRIVVEG